MFALWILIALMELLAAIIGFAIIIFYIVPVILIAIVVECLKEKKEEKK